MIITHATILLLETRLTWVRLQNFPCLLAVESRRREILREPVMAKLIWMKLDKQCSYQTFWQHHPEYYCSNISSAHNNSSKVDTVSDKDKKRYTSQHNIWSNTSSNGSAASAKEEFSWDYNKPADYLYSLSDYETMSRYNAFSYDFAIALASKAFSKGQVAPVTGEEHCAYRQKFSSYYCNFKKHIKPQRITSS